MSLNTGQVLVGRYQVEGEPVGCGGVTLYRAVDALHDRACTLIEVVLSGERPGRQGWATGVHAATRPGEQPPEEPGERFRRGARLLATLDHPCLPQVLDALFLNGTGYLVTEPVEGHSLAGALEGGERVPFAEGQVLAWLDPVMDCLAYCHGRGAVHGGLSPASVLVGPGDRVFVLGLGFADAGLTPGVVTGRPGTSPYRSPEPASPQAQADAGADVYALGAVLYFLLTGCEPVPAGDRLRGLALTSPRALQAGISAQVDAAVMRALALEPDQRHQSVDALRRALVRPAALAEPVDEEWTDLETLQQALTASHWPLVAYDDFQDNGLGWDAGASSDEYSTGGQTIGGGKYRWEARAREGFTWWSCPRVRPVADFYLTVEARQLRGRRDGEYGLVFRTEGDEHYVFCLREDQHFSAYLEYDGDVTTLIDWTATPAIRLGETNRLTVLATGPRVRLLINERCVGEFWDDTMLQGQVGLLVGLEEAGDTAVFEFGRFELRAW